MDTFDPIVILHPFEQLLNAGCIERRGAGLVMDKRLTGQHVTVAGLCQALEKNLIRS